jgi:hypothetical protein
MNQNRRRGAFAGAGAVCLAAVAVLTLTAARSAEPVEPERARYTVSVEDLRLVPPEPGLGTMFTGHGALVDEAGEVAGHSYGTCTGTRVMPDGIQLVCDVAHELADGDIHLSLVTRFDATTLSFTEADTAVVGGTGRYQNVTGSSLLTPLDPLTQTYQWDHELYGVARPG